MTGSLHFIEGMEGIGRQVYSTSGGGKHVKKIKQHVELDGDRIAVGKVFYQGI